MTTPGLTLTCDHVSVPPVGLEETTRFPSPSPATQSEVVGHETAANQVPGSTNQRNQVVAPPVGLEEVKTLPPASTATHKLADGHETDCKWVPGPNGGELSNGPVLDQVNAGVGAAPTAEAPTVEVIDKNPADPTTPTTNVAIPLRIMSPGVINPAQ